MKQTEIPIEPPPVPANQCEGIVRKKRCLRPAVDKEGFCHRHSRWNAVLGQRTAPSGKRMRARRYTEPRRTI